MWSTNQTIVGTSLLDDVTDQVLLSVVCRQYGDLVCWIADHPHVHVYCHNVLGFSQVLQHKHISVSCILKHINNTAVK